MIQYRVSWRSWRGSGCLMGGAGGAQGVLFAKQTGTEGGNIRRQPLSACAWELPTRRHFYRSHASWLYLTDVVAKILRVWRWPTADN